MLRTAFVSRVIDGNSGAGGDGDDDGDDNCNDAKDDGDNGNNAADGLPFPFQFFSYQTALCIPVLLGSHTHFLASPVHSTQFYIVC